MIAPSMVPIATVHQAGDHRPLNTDATTDALDRVEDTIDQAIARVPDEEDRVGFYAVERASVMRRPDSPRTTSAAHADSPTVATLERVAELQDRVADAWWAGIVDERVPTDARATWIVEAVLARARARLARARRNEALRAWDEARANSGASSSVDGQGQDDA